MASPEVDKPIKITVETTSTEAFEALSGATTEEKIKAAVAANKWGLPSDPPSLVSKVHSEIFILTKKFFKHAELSFLERAHARKFLKGSIALDLRILFASACAYALLSSEYDIQNCKFH